MWIQCSEPVKSRCPAYDLYGKLRFASHLRAKVGSQGPSALLGHSPGPTKKFSFQPYNKSFI